MYFLWTMRCYLSNKFYSSLYFQQKDIHPYKIKDCPNSEQFLLLCKKDVQIGRFHQVLFLLMS